MKTWLSSLNGVITLSVLAFLTFLGRLFLDWKYEIRGSDNINSLWSVAIAGGWVWALLAAIRGSRAALIACLIFALVLDLGFAFAMFFFWCPPASCRGFPLNSGLWRWTWAQLIFGLVAATALAFHLRRKNAAG